MNKKKAKVPFVPRPPEAPEVIEARWKKKRERIHQLSNNIRRLRLNVSKDLKSDDEKTCLTALVVAMMDKTAERIGNNSSAADGHFGVSGWTKDHVTISGNQVNIDYVGKSGAEQNKKFTDERLATLLKNAIKNSPSKLVFETSEGFSIKSDRVNNYLKKFGISAKDIRGFSANKWLISELHKEEPDIDEKKRKKQLNKALKKVAAKVGHGRPTLKKHYMIPELWDEYMKDGTIIDISDMEYYEKGGDVSPDEKKETRTKKNKSDEPVVVERFFIEHYVKRGALFFGGYF